MNIPSYIIPIIRRLEECGFEAYLVGGCVRDDAMGRLPNDYDITTNALPGDMLRVFADHRVIETGLKHGTLTVMSEGEPLEITTYRIDGEYTDNRHPDSVSFTDDITLDLSRRDFTVNAMAYSPTLGLMDPFGGMKHLKERRIVCVGSPTARFNEDGLRILRALRFASVLDFTIDPATSHAVRSECHLLRGISKERIFVELTKLLCGVGAKGILRDYPDILAICADGVTAKAFASCADKVAKLPKGDYVSRLALLCRISADEVSADSGKLAVNYMNSLKSSAADRKRCRTLTEAAATDYPADKFAVKRLMGRLDRDDVYAYAAIRLALTGDFTAHGEFLKLYESVAATDPCVKISSLRITGNDVMEITGVRGAEVGRLLGELLDEVIDEKLTNSRGELEAYLIKKRLGDGNK
ncbi:MAG: phosphohydrolase [Clostridia bacterium]|nr:phosphohydrolase [Clostridia bacterium]